MRGLEEERGVSDLAGIRKDRERASLLEMAREINAERCMMSDFFSYLKPGCDPPPSLLTFSKVFYTQMPCVNNTCC